MIGLGCADTSQSILTSDPQATPITFVGLVILGASKFHSQINILAILISNFSGSISVKYIHLFYVAVGAIYKAMLLMSTKNFDFDI